MLTSEYIKGFQESLEANGDLPVSWTLTVGDTAYTIDPMNPVFIRTDLSLAGAMELNIRDFNN